MLCPGDLPAGERPPTLLDVVLGHPAGQGVVGDDTLLLLVAAGAVVAPGGGGGGGGRLGLGRRRRQRRGRLAAAHRARVGELRQRRRRRCAHPAARTRVITAPHHTDGQRTRTGHLARPGPEPTARPTGGPRLTYERLRGCHVKYRPHRNS